VGPEGARRRRFAVTIVPLKPPPTTTIVRTNAGNLTSVTTATHDGDRVAPSKLGEAAYQVSNRAVTMR
jgi:hypothetical protein